MSREMRGELSSSLIDQKGSKSQDSSVNRPLNPILFLKKVRRKSFLFSYPFLPLSADPFLLLEGFEMSY
jgi:hypothetical protein